MTGFKLLSKAKIFTSMLRTLFTGNNTVYDTHISFVHLISNVIHVLSNATFIVIATLSQQHFTFQDFPDDTQQIKIRYGTHNHYNRMLYNEIMFGLCMLCLLYTFEQALLDMITMKWY